MIPIFISNSVVWLHHPKHNVGESFLNLPFNADDPKAIFDFLIQSSNKHALYACPVLNPEETLNNWCEKIQLIEAAGGLVVNQFNELLMIKRLGFWDLPKGKIDQGEAPNQAALREVMEECNVSDLSLDSFQQETWHVYQNNNKWIIKKTYWFLMRTYKQDLTPQTEEGIELACWLNGNEVEKKLEGAYAAINRLIKTAYLKF